MTRWRIASFALVLLLGGCTRSNPQRPTGGDGDAVGVVRAEIKQVPPTISCVQLVATLGTRTLANNFDVTPGQPATLLVKDLPVGELGIAGWAYADACANIGGKQATWASARASVTVVAGQITQLSLTLEPVGGVDVGIDFGSDAGVDMAVPADLATPAPDLATPPDLATSCACTGAQICCAGKCVDPTSDPNNCGVCGAVCGSGRCGSSFGYSAANWSLNGTATFDPSLASINLTAAVSDQTGSASYKNPIAASWFDVSFDFRILPPPMTTAADGMGFIIQRGGPGVVGGAGGGLGMAGLDGFGVELDPYDNDPATPDCGDSSSNHVAIDSLSACVPTGGGQMPTPLFVSNNLTSYMPPITLADGNWHACHIVYTGGLLGVSIDGLQRVSGALPGYSSAVGYYYGFAGATGGLVSRQDVRNVAVSFLFPQCL